MKNIVLFCIGFALIATSCKTSGELSVSKSMKLAETQLKYSLKKHTDKSTFPKSINPDGSLKTVVAEDWTSGFYPGSMWEIYSYTKDMKWADSAALWTTGLERVKLNSDIHNLGFILYSSFGKGLRMTENPRYAQILLQGAQTLSKSFDPKIGSLRSSDLATDHDQCEFPVIIDQLVNLEILFWATKYSGDSTFYDIAVKHANSALENHFREDNSSYHVVDYDKKTGKIVAKKSHHGVSDESAWARGQAWGLYGFTMAYRETGDLRYLEQAEKIADFFINHPNMPSDMIPYWDFSVYNTPNQPRDASAAAIAASALIELSRYSSKGNSFFLAAEKMLKSLSSSDYLAKPKSNQGFILKHSTGNYPGGLEINAPNNYADYYYLEALNRYNLLKK